MPVVAKECRVVAGAIRTLEDVQKAAPAAVKAAVKEKVRGGKDKL